MYIYIYVCVCIYIYTHIYNVLNQGIYLVYMRRSKCLISLGMDTGMRFSLPYISRFEPNILLHWSGYLLHIPGMWMPSYTNSVFTPYRSLTRTSRSMLLICKPNPRLQFPFNGCPQK